MQFTWTRYMSHAGFTDTASCLELFCDHYPYITYFMPVQAVHFHYARCPEVCPVPTWTCPHNGQGGRVHYTHAVVEAV